MAESIERFEGNRMMALIRDWVDSRLLCRLTVADTEFTWITMILKIDLSISAPALIVDRLQALDYVLARYPERELHFEVQEKGGAACLFKTRRTRGTDEALRVSVPDFVLRLQRRRYLRVTARSGTRISFRKQGGPPLQFTVKDYSAGGISFSLPDAEVLGGDDLVFDVTLSIPKGGRSCQFHCDTARTMKLTRNETQELCALEFLDIASNQRERLWREIFQEQRSALRKTGKM